jgi:ribonuclease PH
LENESIVLVRCQVILSDSESSVSIIDDRIVTTTDIGIASTIASPSVGVVHSVLVCDCRDQRETSNTVSSGRSTDYAVRSQNTSDNLYSSINSLSSVTNGCNCSVSNIVSCILGKVISGSESAASKVFNYSLVTIHKCAS